MSQNLTQPEEIDHALMIMTSHEMEMDLATQDLVHLNGITHDFARKDSVEINNSSCCSAQSAHILSSS